MAKIGNFILWILGVLALVTTCQAKEWHGIIPLQSTKQDVIKILGPSDEMNEIRSIHRTEKQEVYIVYSGKERCDSRGVPPGTVLLIQVTPSANSSLTDLQIDTKRLREFVASSQDPDWKGWIDDEQGFIVRTYKQTVDKFFYIASAKDRVMCPTYYSEPERVAQIFVDSIPKAFDTYLDLPFRDEQARLDNFALHLSKQVPTLKAYIVGYSGNSDMPDVPARIARAKQYLISLGIDEDRIVAIVGGKRSEFTVELYALPADKKPPIKSLMKSPSPN
jgi:hypothetical protein